MSKDYTKRYKVHTEGNKVVAESTYAGKPVSGVAKCDPIDTFNEELGTDLAIARCNAKIAAKRLSRAERVVKEAMDELHKAVENVCKALAYRKDATTGLKKAMDGLNHMEKKVRAPKKS